MPVNVVSGATRDTYNVLTSGATSLQVIDMATVMDQLNPSEQPFLVLTKRLGKRKCHNIKVEWPEDHPFPHRDQLNGSAGPGAATLVVDTGTYWAAYDIGVLPATGDVFRITSVATNTLTVTWVLNGGTGNADNAEVWRCSNAYQEGADYINPRSTKEDMAYNYIQITRSPVGATFEEMATKMYTGPDFPYQVRKKGVEHAREIERALWFGERSLVTSGTHPYATARGVEKWISDHVTASIGSMTRVNFDGYLRAVQDEEAANVDGGSTKYYLFTSSLVKGAISRWGNALEEIKTAQTELGFAIGLYHASNGYDIRIVVCPEFNPGTTYAGWGFIVPMNPDRLKYCYLDGLDTHLRVEIQDKGEAIRVDEYYSDWSLELHHQETFGLLKGITGSS